MILSPTRILFVGNSYTSRNQLPQVLVDMAAAGDRPFRLEVKSIVAGGASLRRHWNAGIARQAIASEEWDYVVLQEQSTLPLKNPQRYQDNVRLFNAEIVPRGARTVLYLTWARKAAPSTQDAITRAVEEIAAETKALVVPVGQAWQAALQHDPRWMLYDDDGSHPSAAGTYLAACEFFVMLFDGPHARLAAPSSLKLDPATATALAAFAMRFGRASA